MLLRAPLRRLTTTSPSIIDTFFSPINRQTYLSPPPPRALTRGELEHMGKLAHLNVSERDEEFAKSVGQVVEFCSRVVVDCGNRGAVEEEGIWNIVECPTRRDEEITQGNNAMVVLGNAPKVLEGLFVAPKTKSPEEREEE